MPVPDAEAEMARATPRTIFLALAAVLIASVGLVAAAPDREALQRREFEGKRFKIRVVSAGEHLKLGLWCRDAGLVAQATAEFVRAVEVGEGQSRAAERVLALMRSLDDKFWKTVNPHPSKAYLDTYEKKLRVIEENRDESLFKLARDGHKQGLEDLALDVWSGLLRDADTPLRFDAKEQVLLAAGAIPPDVSAKIKAEAITVNGQLYLRDAFLQMIPQVKEIREWTGERVRVRAQAGAALPEDLLASLEALLPFLQEDMGGRPSRRMTIFVFGDRATYGSWLGAAKLSQFTAASGLADGATSTALVCAEGLPAESVRGMAMHERTHLFQYGVTPAVMPSWYSEGFAETYGGDGTFVWKDGKLEAGGMMERSRVTALAAAENYIPLKDLVAGDALKLLALDKSKGGRFYAESWALLRYMRTSAGPDLVARFRLWEIACRGAAVGAQAGKPREQDTAPATQAFERAFGADLGKIESGFKEWLAAPR